LQQHFQNTYRLKIIIIIIITTTTMMMMIIKLTVEYVKKELQDFKVLIDQNFWFKRGTKFMD